MLLDSSRDWKAERHQEGRDMKPLTATAAAVALTLASLTACTGAGGTADPAASDPSTTRAITTSTPAPSPTSSPTDTDLEAAQQAVVRFRAMTDAIAADPKVRLERLATVARGQALAQWRSTLFRQRLKEWKQIGNVTVVSASAKRKTNTKRYAVTACVDVSKVNVVDRDGKSVVAANRPPRTQDTYIAENTAQGWFVVGEKFQVTTC